MRSDEARQLVGCSHRKVLNTITGRHLEGPERFGWWSPAGPAEQPCGRWDGATQISRADLVVPGHDVQTPINASPRRALSAQAAGAPGDAAAAATTTAAATASPASTTTATSTATAAAAPCGLHGAACILLVEKVERREADVRDLFLTERDRVGCGEVQLLRRVGRHGCRRCRSHERETQSSDTQSRYRGSDCTLSFRSWLRLSHL
jgi:hypothetical protein